MKVLYAIPTSDSSDFSNKESLYPVRYIKSVSWFDLQKLPNNGNNIDLCYFEETNKSPQELNE